jgi:type IV secretory pathway TrbF-like protein
MENGAINAINKKWQENDRKNGNKTGSKRWNKVGFLILYIDLSH